MFAVVDVVDVFVDYTVAFDFAIRIKKLQPIDGIIYLKS